MAADSNRLIQVIDALNLLRGEVDFQTSDDLIESVIAPGSDNGRSDPLRLEGPGDSDLGHGEATFFGDSLDAVDDELIACLSSQLMGLSGLEVLLTC